jgi:hypothetical protein
MSVTEVDICNLALAKGGHEERISQLGEAGRAGEVCDLFYAHIRDAMLAAHPWNFALGRATLSLDVSSPSFEFDYQYLLPADCLRAVELFDTDEPFKIEGNLLLTNSATAQLKYIKKITNTLLFAPLFSEAFATKLGYEINTVMVGSKKITKDDVKDALKEAKRRDGQEGTPDRIISKGPLDFKNGFWK